MATSPAANTYELSTSERELAIRGLETYRASVVRAVKAEHNPDVAKLREAEAVRIDALILRFR